MRTRTRLLLGVTEGKNMASKIDWVKRGETRLRVREEKREDQESAWEPRDQEQRAKRPRETGGQEREPREYEAKMPEVI